MDPDSTEDSAGKRKMAEDEEKDMYEDDAPQARIPAQQLQKYLKN